MSGTGQRRERIFLSHSHRDNEFCTAFVAKLRDALQLHDPDDIFFDRESLHIGDEWLARIQKEVLGRPIFMVLLSPNSVVADYVRHETNLALRMTIENDHRRIVSVLIQQCNPNELAPLLLNYQIADFVQKHFDVAFAELVTALMLPESREQSATASEAAPLLSRDRTRAQELADEVHRALMERRWDDAIVKGGFALTIPQNVNNASLYADIALAYAGARRWEQAQDAASRALGFDAFRADLWRTLATAHSVLGRPGDALAALDHARAVTPLDDSAAQIELLAERRALLTDQRRWAEALDTLDRELRLDPHDQRLLVIRADLVRQLDRDEARSYAALADATQVSPLPTILTHGQWPSLVVTPSGRREAWNRWPESSKAPGTHNLIEDNAWTQVRRLPIYMLVDTSRYLQGERLKAVTSAIDTIHDLLMSNPQGVSSAYISLIQFSEIAEQAEFVSVAEFQSSTLSASAGGSASAKSERRSLFGLFTRRASQKSHPCALGAALRLLNTSLDSDVRPNTSNTRGDYMPQVLLFLSGHPTDNWLEAAQQLASRRYFRPEILGFTVGPDADSYAMTQLCKSVTDVAVITADSVRGLFNWVSASVPRRSTSVAQGSKGAVPRDLPPPPPGIIFEV